MALFNRKKSQDATAPAAAPSTQDDFSDFSPEALTAAGGDENNEQLSKKGAKKTGRKSSSGREVKPGTAVGLNIGSDSIKVVEATAKGSEIIITALGMVPTPEDSISNGLVTNPTALVAGIRDALTQAGIRSKKVVTSVAGTGETIVRVIQVPKMSDEELLDNMKMDADRYIPFPPSEVQMDFKALRELPSDPDSPDMEVLLAASKREVIDSHVKVVQTAKLDPHAIDVEPLSVARALTHPLTALKTDDSALNGNALLDDGPDYGDVSAVLNIGASGTEISILRGDLLVFTRTVPTGGNALTQAIVDHLILAWSDAEQFKREMGDALPPVEEPNSADVPESQSDEDWSSFSEEAFEGASENQASLDEPLPDGETLQVEPGEQHQQKEPEEEKEDAEESTSDAHSFFDFGEETEPKEKMPTAPQETFDYLSLFGEEDDDDADLPTVTDETVSASVLPSAFDFPDEEEAPLEFGTDRLPARRDEATPESAFEEELFGEEDTTLLPSEVQPAAPAAGKSAAPAAPESTSEEPLSATSFDFDFEGTPAAEEPTSQAIDADPFAEFMASGDESPGTAKADLSAIPAIASTSAPAPDVTGADPEAEVDLDALFEDSAPIEAEAASRTGEDAGVFVSTETADLDDAFSGDAGDDLADFGVGLGGVSEQEITPALLHGIIEPVLENLVAEVRRSLEYHTTRYPDAAVNRITIVGGGAKLKNIDAYFTQKLGLPTVIGNPALQLKQTISSLPANYIEENGTIYTVALGLAMRELTL